VAPTTPGGDYEVGLEQLVSMSKNQNISALQQYGGVGLLQHNFVCHILLKPSYLLIL
jgi:Ca2+-transporting ATPase